MQYLISFVSLLSIWGCSTKLFSFISSSVLSTSMFWLVLGSIIISKLFSFQKKSGLWLGFLFVLSSCFFSKSLLLFYIFFEMSLVPIVLMIIYWGSQPERLSAGLYLLIYTSVLSLPFLSFILKSGAINFFFNFKIKVSMVVMILLLAPFLVKMPVFGLHFWLPKAHVEASTSGSMILAGILLKLGSYGIFRLTSIFLFMKLSFMSALWLISTSLASLVTYLQSDIKKLVAYSSVTHMTFMMVGLGVNVKMILLINILLSLSHGWISMGMFANAGMFSSSSSSRLGLLMNSEAKFHWSLILFGLMLISNASLPPFPSFFPELFILSALAMSSTTLWVFVLISLVVCYYNTYIFMWVAHMKSIESKKGMFTLSEGGNSTILILLNMVSLLWMKLF